MPEDVQVLAHYWYEEIQQITQTLLESTSPHVHGNEKRRLWNAAVYADKERAITFIKSYADVHAMPLPWKASQTSRLQGDAATFQCDKEARLQ